MKTFTGFDEPSRFSQYEETPPNYRQSIHPQKHKQFICRMMY
ncbi:MAG: hypothetical protein AB7W47_14215 [Calditrichaceae bacterium]